MPFTLEKTTWRDLAVFGREPLFAQKLHVGRPNVGDKQHFLGQVNDVLDRRWLTNHGPMVTELERRIATYLGVKHCIAVCNGTVALEIAIRANELEGEVIVPAFTFVATPHSLLWQGITPVFCDADPVTHTIDPDEIERHITPRTTGIMGVHVWGQPCAIDRLTAIARRHKLRLLFDASHAFGCSFGGRMIGNFGSAEVFSFHATKFFNTLEGGAIVTNDDEVARRAMLLKNFGFGEGYDNVVSIGTNGKMNEVSAAMGLTNLNHLESFVGTNRRNYDAYRAGLAGIPGVEVFTYNPSERNNFQYVIVEVDEQKAGISRNALVDILHAENVLARRYFYPGCHRMEPYRSLFPNAGLLLPRTEELSNRLMALPTGTGVSVAEIEQICSVIQVVTANAKMIRSRLPKDAVAQPAEPPAIKPKVLRMTGTR